MESKCTITRPAAFQIDLRLEWPAKKIAEAVTGALKNAYKRINSQGVPGFRRGKVPQWLFDLRYDHAVRFDTINKMIRADMDTVLKERSLPQRAYGLKNGHVVGMMGLFADVFDEPLVFVFSVDTAPFNYGWGSLTAFSAS